MSRILVAVDESEIARKISEFTANNFNPNSHVKFISVVPDTAAVCGLNEPSLTEHFVKHQMAFCAMEEKKRQFMEEQLNELRQVLLSKGFKPEHVETKVEIQKADVAQVILNEAENGYDVIILGRRGLSSVREIMIGSVSNKVLHNAKSKTVVIVS
jgi:nucleotide-binding universal stress UspA family protein